MTPRATYRVQFHAGFTFDDAISRVDYWAALGVSHLYASPIATARRGSTHGYDAVDPTIINPHLGGEEGFLRLVQALRKRGLGLILDIVPNHVAVGGEENPWWLDLLERGQASRYARYFDVDWAPADETLHGKILAPFLGAPYAEVLACGDLKLEAEADRDRISVVAYGAHRFPIRPEDHGEIMSVLGVSGIAEISPDALTSRYDATQAEGRTRLHALIERQHWRLTWWRSAGDAINWRRFFDITELAGLRIEEEEVFQAVHALPLRLYAEGLIDGLRVDHVDGLADPVDYCRRLRSALDALTPSRPEALRQPAYFVVEKILGPGEALPQDWQVDGTTGYEFMNEVSALLHAPEGAQPLADFWARASGRAADFEIEEHIAREEMLERNFAGQLDAVAAAAHRAGRSELSTRDFGLAAYRRAAAALIQAFGVYRTYGAAGPPSTNQAGLLSEAVDAAAAAAPLDEAVVRLIGGWLAGGGRGDPSLRAEAVRRFEQLSAPVAAKAVEDTAFYRFGRLLSRNDVGFDPARFTVSAEDFLARAKERGEHFPRGMLTTATHDHKRGEDVRARLSVLSEIPRSWISRAESWTLEAAKVGVHPADALMMVQMIVGAWPLELTTEDAEGLRTFAQRLVAWQVKALREGKLRSSWALPDENYEAVCTEYLKTLLTRGNEQLADLAAFAEQIAAPGAAKGLVQAGLRLTLPGVPDLYQGCEYWDLSLVDPDNRRPVDYDRRLATLGSAPTGWRDGALKQHLIAELLNLRAVHSDVFSAALEPLSIEGPRSDQAVAFTRRVGAKALVVLAVVRTAEACASGPSVEPGWWGDTMVRLPADQVRPAADLARSQPFAFSLLET